MKKRFVVAISGMLFLGTAACALKPFVMRIWLNSRLVVAAKQQDCHKAIAALNAGADPNIAPPGDYPVLTRAVLSWDTCMVSALLDHGADINVHDAWGGTPLSQAIGQYYDLSPGGCRNGHGRDDPDSGCRSYEMVKFLITHGAAVSSGSDLRVARREHDRTHPPNAQTPLPPWNDELIPLLQQSGTRSPSGEASQGTR